LLVLPSADDREHWSTQHPDLAPIMNLPAMIRLEVAAANVPARHYTLKLSRDPSMPPAEELPMSPGLRIGAFEMVLENGLAPYNAAPHAGGLPVGKTEAEAYEEYRRRGVSEDFEAGDLKRQAVRSKTP
jgi:hypothetical protein